MTPRSAVTFLLVGLFIPSVTQAATGWSRADAEQLVAAIEAAKGEGLNPAAYRPDAVRGAIVAGEGAALDTVADAAALALARDYWTGRIADRIRFDWKIERSAYESAALPTELAMAVRDDRVRAWLEGLLPQDPGYASLKAALAAAGDPRRRATLRANLERWRWLPRTRGSDHLLVNIPAYRLDRVRGGAVVERYDVIVGAKATPTPMLALTAEALVVNPWWNVPPSIARGMRANAAKGYVLSGGQLRQRPGPNNSLGRIKIDMPNPDAIYLHDTPNKAAFARPMRALSHGCIRVKDVDRLAADLLGAGGGDVATLDKALAGRATRTLKLERTMPVYLVYFTAEADASGALVFHDDPYDRDAAVAAALDKSVAFAAR